MTGSGTLAAVVERWAERGPASPALLTASGRAVTHADLVERVAALRRWLRAARLDRRSVVALAARGGPAALEATVAIASEAVCAPLPFRQTAAERAAALAGCGACALVADAPSADDVRIAAERGIAVLALRTDEEGFLDVAATISTPPAAASGGARVRVDGACLLLPTSGTTGPSKLVPLPAAALLHASDVVAETLGLRPGDRCLDVMPLHHTHGLVGGALSSLSAGAGVVLVPGFSAPVVVAALEGLGATWYTAVPAIHARVVELVESGALDPRRCSLRFVRSTSARLPVPLRRRLEAGLGVPVVEAYALTEAPGQVCSGTPAEPAPHGSVGRALGCEVVVVDAAGRPVRASVGEVHVRGAHVAPGCLDAAGDALRPFPGGWLRTGDLGLLDGEGNLELAGRAGDVINRAGEKVLPAEVEEAILSCRGVRDAAVAGVPDPVLGEAVAALVVADGAGEDALRRHLAERLSPHKVPDRVRFARRVPRSPLGKVDRRELAAILAERGGDRQTEPVLEGIEAIWRHVLGPDAGLDDDLVESGGASLQAARIEHLVAARFGVALPGRSVLTGAPTARALAALVERLLAAGRRGAT